MRFWFVTTFANKAWNEYAQEGLTSLARYLPAEFKICVGLDDDALSKNVKNIMGASRNIEVLAGRDADHREFISHHAAKDVAGDYRLQAARFCHKIFFLKRFFDKALSAPPEQKPDYVVWWDADAQLTRPVTENEMVAVMPSLQEACSYLGRKDWDHSECGFMGFNTAHNGAADILNFMITYYTQGLVFSLPQWHDSYLFDVARKDVPCKNISEGVAGNNVWAGTALGQFSAHWKGPQAKARKKALTDNELFGEEKKS